MAAGSQLENGTWALLVHAASIMLNIITISRFECQREIILQWVDMAIHPMESRIRASPMRFVRAVIIPALRDFGLA